MSDLLMPNYVTTPRSRNVWEGDFFAMISTVGIDRPTYLRPNQREYVGINSEIGALLPHVPRSLSTLQDINHEVLAASLLLLHSLLNSSDQYNELLVIAVIYYLGNSKSLDR